MYRTTGFKKDQIRDLCALVWQESQGSTSHVWPPILGLYRSAVGTLTYLRRNRDQVELAETYEVSQSTVSRAIMSLTGVLGSILADYVPVPEDLDERRQYIVDGTLLPCWSWAGHRELYSGKHRTTGKSVQVACLHNGALAWISDPVDGSRHDSYAIRQSGVMDTFEPKRWIGDKGYVGLDMLTPIKHERKRRAVRGMSRSCRARQTTVSVTAEDREILTFVADDDELVGLWDSSPYAYGAMESSTLALLCDGTGWGVWTNAAGGMELVTLVWVRAEPDVFSVTELQLMNGSWDATRPHAILLTEEPATLSEQTRYRYDLVRETPPLETEPMLALKLDRAFMFSRAYSLRRQDVTEADHPAIIDIRHDQRA